MQTRTRRPSRSQLLVCAAALAGAAGLLGSVLAAHAEPPGGGATVTCVKVRTEASFATVGYDHLVQLTNNCKTPVACTVTTNVNPEPASVALGVNESTTLTTWRGSPAREFTADAKCQAR
jgi:hypothetical protein